MEDARVLACSAPLVVSTLKTFALSTLNKSPAEAGAISRDRLLKVRTVKTEKKGDARSRKRAPEFKAASVHIETPEAMDYQHITLNAADLSQR